MKDRESRYIRVNKAQATFVGENDPRDLIGRTDGDYCPPALAERYAADDRTVMETGRSLTNLEEGGRDAKGALRWLLTTKIPLLDSNGHVTGIVGISRDITERKRTEEALRESESRYRLLLETLNEGVWAVDQRGATVFVNPRMVAMLGYEEGEMLGRSISSFMEEPAPLEAHQPSERARGGGVDQVDRIFVCKNGNRIATRMKTAPVVSEAGDPLGMIASVMDLTEQRAAETAVEQLQQQLLQAQKMEAIGRLAGGVAHDFNNLLTTILGNCELIMDEPGTAAAISEYAGDIERAGRRAAELTQQLLAFSRKQMLQPRVIDLNGLVENLSKMLRRLIGEDVLLDLRLAPGPASVRADPGQIEQVIVNLAVNARDAMPEGGRLLLETRTMDIPTAIRVERFDIEAGVYVCLRVSDTGCGMGSAVKSRLFEPFFTTKEKGKGTGLGLSTVYGIVKQSGGYITVESEPGHGAAFSVFLPRMDASRIQGEIAGAQAAPRGGAETILLVEDEASVLQLTTRMLEGLGYRVTGVRTPGEALELTGVRGLARVDLLITDVVLTEMKGTELAGLLRERMPGLRILFTSGYTDEITFQNGVLAHGNSFLQKPYSRNALASKVREVLEAHLRG